MNFEFTQATHVGDRAVNQDFAAHSFGKGWALFVVCDGLGGHESGELASQGFCGALVENSSEFSEEILKNPESGMRNLVVAATTELTERLLDLGHPDARTTAAIVWLTPEHTITTHIGDSRVYLVDNKEIKWQTNDHSLMQQLLDAKKLSPEETLSHPSQTVLLRTISCHEPPNPEIHVHTGLAKGQLLLLCSDGLWQYASPEDIESLVDAINLEEALKDLVVNCVIRSQPYSDNVTAQAIRLK